MTQLFSSSGRLSCWGRHGGCDQDFFDPTTVLESWDTKLRMKNYSLPQINFGANGERWKMDAEKRLLSLYWNRSFIAFLGPMFEAVWQTYHNKKVDLIFGYVVQFGINFAKMDVNGGKVQNWSICVALSCSDVILFIQTIHCQWNQIPPCGTALWAGFLRRI